MSRKHKTGRHLLQIPGPSNVPDRILRAMDFPTIDHRSEEFFELAKQCLSGIKDIFKTKSNVIIYRHQEQVLGRPHSLILYHPVTQY